MQNQRGFTLIEVMFASMALGVLVVGLAAFYRVQSVNAADLVLRQQAIYVLNAEAERITALYTYSNFGSTGPELTTGYTETAALPASRYIYPSDLSTWQSNGQNIMTSSAGSFSGKPFTVYFASGTLPALDRTYVWISEDRGIIGRLSWTASDIVVGSCSDGGDCLCNNYSGVGGGYCQTVRIFLEYPYRLSGGNVVPPAKPLTVSVATIVGRGE